MVDQAADSRDGQPSAPAGRLNRSVDSGVLRTVQRRRYAFADLVAAYLDRPWILVAALLDGQDKTSAHRRQGIGPVRQPYQVAGAPGRGVGGHSAAFACPDEQWLTIEKTTRGLHLRLLMYN